MILSVPCVTAVLANTFRNGLINSLVFLWLKNLNNEHWKKETKPHNRLKPPTNKYPVYPVMFFLKVCFIDNLHIYIFTTTFRTFHKIPTFLLTICKRPYNFVSTKERGKHLMSYKVWELRTALGYSLRDLEVISGVSKTEINDIENGKANPSITTLLLLAAGLQVELTELFTVV